MRRWILSERAGEVRVKSEDECSFTDEELTAVMEVNPVLDLFEDCLGLTNRSVQEINRDLRQALRSFGRDC